MSTRCSASAPSMEGRTQLSCVRPPSASRSTSAGSATRESRFAELRGVASRELAPSSSLSSLLTPPSLRMLSCIRVSSLCFARASARNACSCLKRPMCFAMSVAKMSVVTRFRNRSLSLSSRNATIPTSSSSRSSNSKPRWKFSRTLSRYFLYSACLLFFRNALFRRKCPASCPRAPRYSASTSTGSNTSGGRPLCRQCVAASTSCGQTRAGEDAREDARGAVRSGEGREGSRSREGRVAIAP